MKATALLEKQHAHVRSLFKRLEGKPKDIAALLDDLASSLAAHMAIEQELFYPEVRELKEDLVLESFEEHALAEIALKRLLATDPEDASFKARVVATKELIEHHVKEEEEELFPKVEKAIEAERLTQLGKQMKQRFDEVQRDGFEAAVPRGVAKTSADVAKPKSMNTATRH